MNQLIDDNVQDTQSILGDNIWIRAGTELIDSIIENDVFINFKCRVQNTFVSDHTQIASRTKIGGKGKSTHVGRSCWIGTGACICAGVRIGDNCVIGAYTIVNQDIPNNSIAYGRENLTIKRRKIENDGLPCFRKTIENNLVLRAKGKYLKCDANGNYISATLTGDIPHMGSGNILIGNRETCGFIGFGRNVNMGSDNILEGAGQIVIGSGTKIGNNVHIVSNSHDYHYSSLPMIFQSVRIGKNVLIRDKVIILGGISIPDNTTIGENCFIRKTKDLERT